MFRQRNFGWVQHVGQIAFGRIAAAAGVQEIVVVADVTRCQGLGTKMLDAEYVLAIGAPPLAAKAVNAAKLKLVSQPWFEALWLRVTLWSVPANVGTSRVLKWSHQWSAIHGYLWWINV